MSNATGVICWTWTAYFSGAPQLMCYSIFVFSGVFCGQLFFLLPVFCHYSGCSSISYSDMYCDPMIGLNYVMLICFLIIFIKDITNIYFLNIFFWNPAGVVCFFNNFVFPLVLFINHRSIAIYRCLFLVLSIRLIMIIIWYFNWFSKDV